MATLTVLKFHEADAADKGLELLKDLQKRALIKLHDAAIVTWPEGAKKPKTRQLLDLTAAGAWDGAFWGMLFGLIFFVPFFGAAVGGLMVARQRAILRTMASTTTLSRTSAARSHRAPRHSSCSQARL